MAEIAARAADHAAEIQLAAYRPEYLKPFLQWRSEPLTVRHNPLKEMLPAEIEMMLANEGSDLSRFEQHDSFRWFILVRERPVGSVSLKNISRSMRYAEIGYGVAQDQQGKGTGTAGVRLMVDMVFARSTLRRLIAYVDESNQASRRLLEKLGFQEEGVFREHYLIQGKPVNEVVYGLLKSDWLDR